ncbi:hypothetical protein SH601_11515 [Gracilibacillus sp. S3-1-1]|uniref:Uncharacterized protein n=1 Tax=Gracilibacillus pellucidus TaxID=3095368 RepID=A0ACC6M6R1_9BACI|nr:hypothetical protein [Gracilibacillus sp. S3-1-1]MDX8046610.1 hypothetical protein [Gracilibacillus sp. S3-1-1]
MKKNRRDQTSIDMNQLMTDYVKDLMNNMDKNDTKKNNSFIYLENETLHMLLLYLLTSNQDHLSVTSTSGNLSSLHEQLELYMDDNRQLYQELIQLIKEQTESSQQNE